MFYCLLSAPHRTITMFHITDITDNNNNNNTINNNNVNIIIIIVVVAVVDTGTTWLVAYVSSLQVA